MAYNVSNEYNEVIYSEDAKHKLKLLFNGVEYTDSNIKTEYVKVKSNILSSGEERFSLDNFVSKEAEIVIHDIDLEDIVAPISISIGTLVDEDNDTYEYVPIGIFNIDETPTTDNGVTTIKLKDNAVKFDFPYDGSGVIEEHDGEATMLQILQDICEKAGVDLETTDFINKDTKVSVWDNSINARVYVMYISEKAGCIATISRDGKLQLINLQRGDLLEETINTQGTIENVLEIDKIQELSGNTFQQTYTGKNLLNSVPDVSSKNGVTVSYNSVTQEITLNGTCTVNNSIVPFGEIASSSIYGDNTFTLPANTRLYIKIQYVSGTSEGSYRLAVFNNSFGTGLQAESTQSGVNVGRDNQWTTSVTFTKFRLRFENGTKFNNYKVKLLMSTSGYDYEPFVGRIPSPNPNYPQAIENVTGLQTITRCGKNILNNVAETQTINQVVFTRNSDGSFNVNGTASGITTLNLIDKNFILPAGQYTLTGCPSGGGTNTWRIDINNGALPSQRDEGNGATFTLTEDFEVFNVRIRIANGVNVNNLTFKPMLEVGNQKTTYEPYTAQNYELNLGKNLFNFTGETHGSNVTPTITDNELKVEWTGGFNVYLTDIVNLSKDKTYTISFKHKGDGLIIKNSPISTTATVYQTGTHSDYTECSFNISGVNQFGMLINRQVATGGMAYIKDIQVEAGSQATSYSPYFTPIELNRIPETEYEDSIKKSTGKNLFDETYENIDTTIVYKPIYVGNGIFTLSTTAPLNTSSSANLFFLSGNVNAGANTGGNGIYINRSIPQRSIDGYVTIAYRNSNGVDPRNYATQLELGNSATNYEPYLPKGTWYIEKQIGKVVLDGSETWDSQTAYTGYYRFKRRTALNTTNSNGMNNRFTQRINQAHGDYEYLWIQSTSGGIYIQILQSRLSDGNVSTFKTWLSTHNTEVDYVLATPTYTEITNEELINQLESIALMKGTNNITITSNDLTGSLKLSYYEEKQPIELNPLLMESYKEGEKLQISRVVYEDAIRKFEYGDEDNGTLYINSANPYITNTTEIEKIYNSINGFNIYSMNISKMIGNPALDPWDLIGFTWNNKTYKTLAQNTLTFNGKITQSFDTQIGTNAKTQENVTLNTDVSKFRKFSTEINQLNGTITMVAGEVDENTQRITTVEQDVNEIKQTAISYEDLIRNKQQVRMLHIENAFPNYPLKLSIKNASLVFPNNNLYPSNTLYTKDSYLIVDKTEQLSENAKMYHLPLTKLYVKDGVYDEFVVEKKNMYVIHRIGVNNDNTTYILDNEVIEDLGTIDIELFKGDNYIYLYSFQNDGVIYEITYTIPSEFTNVFATEVYVDSSIEQTANQILLQVNEKVDENEIIAKLNVAVEDGQGIVNLVGNTVTIGSDNFQLDANGKIKSTAGEIGGFNIMPETLDSPIYPIRKRLIDGEYVEEEFEIYSDEFCEAIREIMQSGRTPTQEELDLYDLNHNGRIDSGDYYLAKSTQVYNISKDKPGKFSINTKSVNNVLTIYDKDENERVNLGMLAMDFKNLNGDKANIAPGGFSISNSNQISNAVLGTGDGYALLNLYGDDSSFISANASSSPTLIVKASGTQTYIDNTKVQANAFVNTSLESKKENISKVKNGLDILKNIDIYTYNYKDEIKSEKINESTKISKKAIQQPTKKHYGVVIGDDYNYSSEITDSKNEGVDLYSFISVCCASIKEQQEQIEELQKEIKLLKEEK